MVRPASGIPARLLDMAVRGLALAPGNDVSILRARAQYLGTVYAPDEKAAEARAIEEFKVGIDQRRRLFVREQE